MAVRWMFLSLAIVDDIVICVPGSLLSRVYGMRADRDFGGGLGVRGGCIGFPTARGSCKSSTGDINWV